MSSSQKIRTPAWIGRIFPFPFLIGGFTLLFLGSREVIDGISSKGWPQAEGVINESRVAVGSRSGKERTSYSPEINYTYSFQGDTHYSDRILFGSVSFGTLLKSSKRRSDEWVAAYPAGKSVMVAVNPTDPAQSTLVKGMHPTSLFQPAIGLAFLLVGLLAFRPVIMQKRGYGV